MLPLIVFACTAFAYYKVVDVIEKYTHLIKSPEHIGRFSSIACTLLISAFHKHSTLAGTYCFLSYLLFDTFLRRHRLPLNTEGYIHHAVGILLALGGIYILQTYKFVLLYRQVVSTLLNMELTTPVLHAAWIAKEHNETHLSTILFILLLNMWIPLRLLYPVKFLKAYLMTLGFEFVHISMFIAISILVAMQFVWFKQLCVVGFKNVCKWYHIK
jgi:hypothetical protein